MNGNKEIKNVKMNLENLPHVGKNINWFDSKNYKVSFQYRDIIDELRILDVFRNSKNETVLKIIYNEKSYNIYSSSFKKGHIGVILDIVKSKTKEFTYKIGDIFKDDKRDISIIDREYKKGQNWKYYKYHCYKDRYEGWIEENNLKNGQGCSVCCNRTPVLGINTIWDTDRWMCDLGVSEEDAKTHSHGSNDKVQVTCPDCGKTKYKTIYEVYKNKYISCDCSDSVSYPNKFSYELLNQLNKIYNFDYLEHEYSPNWIKPRRYDNYFIYKGKKYIIGMDGALCHGKKDNPINGMTKEESKAVDDYKDKQAMLHGIKKPIRIDCDYPSVNIRFEYIKQNILNNIQLNNLFDLSKIDWNKCHEFACSNLVKMACEYKKNNDNITTTEIGNIMGGYGKGTISRWLKQGNEIWCKYDPEEEKKQTFLTGKERCKKVEIFKNGVSLGIFESATEIERISEKLFGVKLLSSMISVVCNNKVKHYKNFTFKFV